MHRSAEVVSATGGLLAARDAAGERIPEEAERIAAACRDMAVRFHRGGKILVFGNGGAGADANHVAVEFVHPVVVGKRALPALSLNNDVATITDVARKDGFADVFAHQLRCLADPRDIALGVTPDGRCPNVVRAVDTAKELGLLTVVLAGGDGGDVAGRPSADHVLLAHADDPLVVKEAHVTIYHILWELVHVFFEQPGVLDQGVSA
ncbi:SIS domain-containing protein [Nocardiopsis rhodophaea]|uniref:D-sedoheptulose-7-phosphate isomerase n=1 Tax=Nocardiopsis rhodophaea TaxID=280238 RepID=UPI0031E02F3E